MIGINISCAEYVESLALTSRMIRRRLAEFGVGMDTGKARVRETGK